MKKIIKNCIRFISFALVLVLLMAYLSFNVLTSTPFKKYSYPTRNMFFQTIEAEDKDTLDVLFVGDSSIMYATNPLQLWNEKKITSYVMSYTMMRPNEAYFDIVKVFKNQKPKVLFLEASFLADVYDEEDVYSTRKVKNIIDYMEFQVTGGVDYLLPVMKYRNTIETIRLDDFIKRHPKKFNSINKGFNYANLTQESKRKPIDDSKKVAEFIDCAEIYFAKIYKICEKNDCKLVILNVPHIGYWSASKHDKVAELAKDYNVDYLDYDQNPELIEPEFSWKTDTKDGGFHLNYSGSKKVTKTIGNYLTKEVGLAPTVLDEVQIEHWDDDTRAFYESINEKV